MRWEIEQPFDGQLFQEYLCQKSSKSVNPFLKLQSIMSGSLFRDTVYSAYRNEVTAQ